MKKALVFALLVVAIAAHGSFAIGNYFAPGTGLQAPHVGQSFVAQTGESIISVDFYMFGAQAACDFMIYDGTPDLVPPSYFQGFDAVDGYNQVTLDTPFGTSAGNTYTFMIWGGGEEISLSYQSFGDVYAEGTAWVTGGMPQPNDLDFNAFMDGEAPLPVTLSSFTASFSNGSSLLSWSTQSESNNMGWNVYRSETENTEDYIQINQDMIEGAGTTTEQTDYTFADGNETNPNSSYWYWLESVDYSGAANLHGPARIDTPDTEDELPPELLSAYGLAQNFPNPFNPSTRIAYKLSETDAQNAKLFIYNSKGQIVKVFDELATTGSDLGSVTWNGNDNSGNAVSSGIYMYKLKTVNTEYTKKMIMIK